MKSFIRHLYSPLVILSYLFRAAVHGYRRTQDSKTSNAKDGEDGSSPLPFSSHARNPVAGNGNTRRMIDRCERDIFFNLVSLVQFNRSLRRKLFQREESLSIRAKRKFEKYISLRSPTLSRYGIRIIYNAREFRVDFSVSFFFSFLFDTKLFF